MGEWILGPPWWWGNAQGMIKSTDQGQKPLVVPVSDPDRYFYSYPGRSFTSRGGQVFKGQLAENQHDRDGKCFSWQINGRIADVIIQDHLLKDQLPNQLSELLTDIDTINRTTNRNTDHWRLTSVMFTSFSTDLTDFDCLDWPISTDSQIRDSRVLAFNILFFNGYLDIFPPEFSPGFLTDFDWFD